MKASYPSVDNSKNLDFPRCPAGSDHGQLLFINGEFQTLCSACIKDNQTNNNINIKPSISTYIPSGSSKELFTYNLFDQCELLSQSCQQEQENMQFQAVQMSEERAGLTMLHTSFELLIKKIKAAQYNLNGVITYFDEHAMKCNNPNVEQAMEIIHQIFNERQSAQSLSQLCNCLRDCVDVHETGEISVKKIIQNQQVQQQQSQQQGSRMTLLSNNNNNTLPAETIHPYTDSIKQLTMLLFKLLNLAETLTHLNTLKQHIDSTKTVAYSQKQSESQLLLQQQSPSIFVQTSAYQSKLRSQSSQCDSEQYNSMKAQQYIQTEAFHEYQDIIAESEFILQAQQLQAANQQLSGMQSTIQQLNQKLNATEASYAELQDKFIRSQRCVVDLSSELEKVSQILQLSGEFAVQVKKQREEVREDILIEENKVLKGQIEELEQSIKQFKENERKIIKSKADIEEKIQKCERQLVDSRDEISQVQILNKSLQAIHQEMIDQNKKTQEQLDKNYQQKITGLEGQLREKESMVHQLQTQINTLDQQNTENQQRIQFEKAQAQQEKEQLKRTQQHQGESATVLESERASLEKDKQQLLLEKSQSDKQISQLKQQISQLTEEITEQNKQLNEGQELKMQQQNKIDLLKQQTIKCQETIKGLLEQQNIFEKTADTLEQENIKMKEIIKQCKDQIQLDERNIYKLEAEIKTLNQSVKSAHRLITDQTQTQQQQQQSMKASKIGYISSVNSRKNSIDKPGNKIPKQSIAPSSKK